METTGRFLQSHAGSFFLFGPRGTGKSTWLRALQSQALWIDMLDPETLRLFQARPERLQERIAAQSQVTDVVIDEVQKVPALLDVVHKLVEGDRPLRFILTGSSARKLRRGAVWTSKWGQLQGWVRAMVIDHADDPALIAIEVPV